MEWKADEVMTLINLYKRFECLWNFNSPLYKRIDLRVNAWQETAQILGKDIDEVKKKIKNLRTAYVAERKKVESRKKSGSPDSVYTPHLYYYSKLQFLDPVVILRKTGSTFEMSDDNTSFSVFNEAPPSPDVKKKRTWNDSAVKTPPPFEFQPMTQIDEQPLSLPTRSDEHAAFGDHIAAELRRLPSKDSHRLKTRLTRVLLDFWEEQEAQQQDNSIRKKARL